MLKFKTGINSASHLSGREIQIETLNWKSIVWNLLKMSCEKLTFANKVNDEKGFHTLDGVTFPFSRDSPNSDLGLISPPFRV